MTSKGESIKNEERKPEKKQPYDEPKVLVTYEKRELEETIKPHGPVPSPVVGD